MKKDNVTDLVQPGEFKDQLTEILKQGARKLVLQAVEAEFASFLQSHEDGRLEDGRKRVVRHGHLPKRKVVRGIGAIPPSKFPVHEIAKQMIKKGYKAMAYKT